MSLNRYTIIRVIGYFINKDSRRWQVVLRLYKIISKYINKNIAGVLINLFYNYRIAGNIKYFIADNMELNNIYIISKYISKALYKTLTILLQLYYKPLYLGLYY